MTSAHAILTGAALICVSVLAVGTIPTAHAQLSSGPFHLMHHTNPTANAGVFRLDTATGEVSYCFVTGEAQLVCSRGVR
jgi:hypothetical protein